MVREVMGLVERVVREELVVVAEEAIYTSVTSERRQIMEELLGQKISLGV